MAYFAPEYWPTFTGIISKPFISENIEIDRTVIAKQEVNPKILGQMDVYNNTPGAGMIHEVTEAYIGGQISRSTGIPAGPAIVGKKIQFLIKHI